MANSIINGWRWLSQTALMVWGLIMSAVTPAGEVHLEQIKLPPGFHISVYANVPNAREMALGANGTLFVGSMHEGKVYAAVDRNHANRGDAVYTIADGLDMPSGIAFHNGALYVAAVNRILRYDNIEQNLTHPPRPVVVTDQLPSDHHHGWKFIAFGPDGKLYVPVGAPCNICEPDANRYALIHRMNPDGSHMEVYARGIRNTVGFDWSPIDHALWFTDNGRDLMGDNLPPDELNHAPRAGMNFGYPYCHGGDIPDPEFGKRHPCSAFTPPAQKLGPHVASLGMRFYTGTMFPPEYRNQIFIAEHGSWNRSHKIGYRVSLVQLQGDRPVAYRTFAEGWQQGERAWGRPDDVLVMPDGALLVSDDTAGVIYRISYGSR